MRVFHTGILIVLFSFGRVWSVSVDHVCDVRRGCIGGVIIDGILCACWMRGLLLSRLFVYL